MLFRGIILPRVKPFVFPLLCLRPPVYIFCAALFWHSHLLTPYTAYDIGNRNIDLLMLLPIVITADEINLSHVVTLCYTSNPLVF